MPQSLSVLHVEDDFADAMLLQHALCDAGGYDMELQVGRTLRDARFKLSRKTYDLIIADLRLPDSTQPSETVNLLERQAKGTPILVLSGSAGIDLQSSGDQTLLECVRKIKSGIVEHVDNWSGRKQKHASPVASHGDSRTDQFLAKVCRKQ